MAERITLSILDLAAATDGICTRRELVDAGLSVSAIDRRVRSGLLWVVHHGVYQVRGVSGALTAHFAATKAVPGSLVSRQSAGLLHGFALGDAPSLIHVTTANGRSQTLRGVQVHETRRLLADDATTTSGGLPITSPARTIVDLAAFLGPRKLRHLVQTQIAARRLTGVELHACVSALARRGLPGLGRLDGLLLELFASEPLPMSDLELRVQTGLLTHGVTGFRLQFRPPWYDGLRGVVDFGDPVAKVIIEADGRRWHATEQAMTDDRRRDRTAASHGWVVLRVTWSEVVNRPAATFGEIAAVASARRGRHRAA